MIHHPELIVTLPQSRFSSDLALAQFVVLSVVAVAVLVVASSGVTQVAFALGAHLIELRGEGA